MGKQARERVLPDTHAKAVGTMIRTSPRMSPEIDAISSRVRRHSASVLRVWRSNCSPAGVSLTPLPRRSKIGTPISASSLRICRLTAEDATLSCSAARRIDPARAT